MKTAGRMLSFVLACVMAFSVAAFFPQTIGFAEEENIALGKKAYVNRNKIQANRITDGKADTAWGSQGIPLYAEVDLAANYILTKVVVKQPLKESYVKSYGTAFNVYGSTDGVEFDRIGTMEAPEKATEEGFVFDIDAKKGYRVIRVMSTMSTKGSNSATYISEIEAYGEKTNTEITPTRTSIDIQSYDAWLLENCGVDLSAIRDAEGKYDVKDTYTAKDTVKALEGLVTRILGSEYLSWFEFDVGEPLKNGKDYYEISDSNGKIHIKGNEGVSIATGLNYYLKYFCKVHVSQETSQTDMPEKVVPVGEKITKETDYEVRYTYNYCTLSYTMSYYSFAQWQRELDYLMLSGINVVLDTTATEALWVLYLQNYGYTVQEAIEFVCGYTWKAWWLMGNLESTGGPVSDNWIVDTVEMARVNQRYLAVMGADPCLQVFTGTMPTDFAVHAGQILADQGYDNIAKYMTSTGSWAGFTRPYALNTTYDGFDALAKKFYEVQNYIYGRIGDYYAGDFLHEIEGGFNLDKKFDKANMSRTVLDKMLEENDEGVWIIQSWWANPLPEVVRGWGDDREDHILLLDLAAAQSPRWTNTKDYGDGVEFGGTSWCFCILEDYGGRDGAHISFSKVLSGFKEVKRKRAKHIKGIGLTSEGTERNPAVFDFFWELAWNNGSVTLAAWFDDYAERRYGAEGDEEVKKAWNLLYKSVYGVTTADGTTVNYCINNYPKFDYTGGYFKASFNAETFENALSLLIDAYDKYKDKETYVYDIVELFSTELSERATVLLAEMFEAAKKGDYHTFHSLKTKYLRIMMLVDELNSYAENQLLGKWVGRIDEWCEDPKTAVYSDFDRDLMKLDAVMLITNWSTLDLGNYAYRQYNGLMEDYYYRMWNNFLSRAEEQLKEGKVITDGGTTMGISNVVTNYNIGREVALSVMNGKKYLSNPVPVDGDATHRSLKEVIVQIRDEFFSSAKTLPNSAVLKEGSNLKITNGVLEGTAKGNTAADIAAEFSMTCGGKVAFVKENALLADDAVVEAGLKMVIVEDDGSVYDVLGVNVGKIAVDQAAKNETEAFKKTLSDFVSVNKGLDMTDYDSRVKGTVENLLEMAVKLSASGGSYAILKETAERADAVKADIEAEKKVVAETRRLLKAELDEDFAELKNKFSAADSSKIAAGTTELYSAATKAVASLKENATVSGINAAEFLVIRAGRALAHDVAETAAPVPSEPSPVPSVTPNSGNTTSSEKTSGSSEDDRDQGKNSSPAVYIVVAIAAAVVIIAAGIAVIAVRKKKK